MSRTWGVTGIMMAVVDVMDVFGSRRTRMMLGVAHGGNRLLIHPSLREYACRTYWWTIRCVLKNEAFRAMHCRMMRTHASRWS